MPKNISKPFNITLSLININSMTSKYKCFYGEDIQLLLNVVDEFNIPVNLLDVNARVYYINNGTSIRQDDNITITDAMQGKLKILVKRNYMRLGSNTIRVVLYDEDEETMLQPFTIECIDTDIMEEVPPEDPEYDYKSEIYKAQNIANTNQTKIGDLNTLKTTVKSDLVSGINEIVDLTSSNKSELLTNIGDINTLKTAIKSDLVSGINEIVDITSSNKSELLTKIETNTSQLEQIENKQCKSSTDFIDYKTENDDWEMLQKCLDSINQIEDRNGGYVNSGWSEKTIFPTGDFKISKPLVCTLAHPNIDFQGCRIKPTSNFVGDYAIDFRNIWNGSFKNLTLDGFSKHIRLYNNNIDSGKIQIDNVNFYGGDLAYDITCQSSRITISNYKFNNVKKCIMSNACDKLTLAHGWIDSPVFTKEYEGLFEINASSQMLVDDLIYVPREQTLNRNKIFVFKLNFGSLTIKNSLFGGEPGQIAIVGNFATTTTGRGSSIRIKDCTIFQSVSAIIELFDIPNYIEIDGINGSIEPNGDKLYINYNNDFKTLDVVKQTVDSGAKFVINGTNGFPIATTQKDLLNFLCSNKGEKYGYLSAITNTVYGEVKFDAKRNSVDAYVFRRGQSFKLKITNRGNLNPTTYSEYIVQANYDGTSGTVLPIIEGTHSSASRAFFDNNILKIKTNGATSSNNFYYILEPLEPIHQTGV